MGEKPRHWISVPHEGPREFEFELAWVEFSDEVTRGICTSDAVPVDYWPRVVYVANLVSGTYEVVGTHVYQEGGRMSPRPFFIATGSTVSYSFPVT